MRNYRELGIWQKSYKLVLEIYKSTELFPAQEKYALVSQIRRAASSIPANIAEGCGRNGNNDFCRFLDISLGSAFELDNHLLLSKDLGYLSEKDYNHFFVLLDEVKKMVYSFRRSRI